MKTGVEMLAVEQSDRDAAIYAVADDGSHSSYMMVEAISSGGADDWPLVQAFARHRLDHTHPAATGSVREALAKVQEFLREPDHAEHFGTDQLLEWINRRPTHIIPKLLAAAPTPDAAASRDTLTIAVDQNDAMRQELAHIGNLVSRLAGAMHVDQANPDGSWPDLAGRIEKLIAAAPDAAASDAGEVERVMAAMNAWTHGEQTNAGQVWVFEGGKRVASFDSADDAWADMKQRNAKAAIAALTRAINQAKAADQPTLAQQEPSNVR